MDNSIHNTDTQLWSFGVWVKRFDYTNQSETINYTTISGELGHLRVVFLFNAGLFNAGLIIIFSDMT